MKSPSRHRVTSTNAAPDKALIAGFYARGLIVNVTGGDVIRLLPPYVIRAEEVDRGLSLLREALKQL